MSDSGVRWLFHIALLIVLSMAWRWSVHSSYLMSCYGTYKGLRHKAHVLRGGREQGRIDERCGRVDALVTKEAKGVILGRLRERLLLLLRHRRKHVVEVHVRCVKSESSALHCLGIFVYGEGRCGSVGQLLNHGGSSCPPEKSV